MFVVIKDFPNYSISPEGVVMNNVTGRILKGGLDLDGYHQITLCDKGRRRSCKVHREVCLTFLPNPDNLPVVNHIDGIKTNNNVENLEWCTISHNTKHAYKLGALCQKGEKNNACKHSDERVEEIVNNYDGGSIAAYARGLDVPYAVVYSYIRQLRRKGSTTIREEYTQVSGSAQQSVMADDIV